MINNKIEEHLKKIYGDISKEDLDKFVDLINSYNNINEIKSLDQKTAYLITYSDSVYNKNDKTFDVLNKFSKKYLKGYFTDIHLLPMFEYTSDDGFSVVDYMKINEDYGDWDNLEEINKNFRLMYDFVANHISKESQWFQKYLKENDNYKDFFISYDKSFNYEDVVRPRTSPLFHEYMNNKKVWTTFSEDQVDLNYKNINVLYNTTEIFLKYIKNNASSIRLDAIGFIWKESATSCMHLKEAHEIIKMWRTICDYIAPNMQIITETNVPHQENISYFGNNDEANQVYQFALPPLVLHTFISNDSSKFNKWAKQINKVGNEETYFNFLASHDGIGMRPVEHLLDEQDKESIVKQIEQNGGLFNYKVNPDGSQSVYELNITYFDALKSGDDLNLNIERFISAHFILLSLIGVPAIYINSIIGASNYVAGVEESGINRRINREKFQYNDLIDIIENDEKSQTIYNRLTKLLKTRGLHNVFNPYTEQEVMNLGNDVICIVRSDGTKKVFCLTNVTSDVITIDNVNGIDIVNEIEFNNVLEPFESKWVLLR